MKQLDVSEKQNTTYCISTQLRDEQIKINLAKISGRIEPVSELRTEPIAIVCFAPSLNETWEEIKKFKYIMTCSGAHKFLIDKGIIPTYHLDLDPRPHKIKILGEPHKDVEYLIASTIHPNYLTALQSYNVKLWHIFANEEEGSRILPRGEWMITGGSSVGLRCMTVARFLGFTDFHIFGMDGSMQQNKTHTTEHPNPPKEYFETEYNGKKFFTTPSMLHVAQETFKELNQMGDVKATFYGEGLVQEMAKNYVPELQHDTLIAFNKPQLISKEYVELNRKLHQDVPTYGMGGSKHRDTVLEMMKKDINIKAVLDYGAGKMQLQKSLPFPIYNYDPAIPEISQAPPPADLVVCTDVLEHIEPDRLGDVLTDLKRCVKMVGYFVISTRQAIKTYANGQNTHLIVKGKDWWTKKLEKYFQIGTVIEKEKESELHIVVGPKRVVEPETIKVEQGDIKVKFLTPNDTTKWRANTLLTKEPITIEWINGMKKGEVLYDVGANVGGYSIWAAAQGVNVFSFEPEAENYAILVKNLMLNKLRVQAYPIAITDKQKVGFLGLSTTDIGGSQNTFDGHSKLQQGCISMTLDSMVENKIPSPDHIKIDVDGLEPSVINGALNILSNGVKSVLVEVNPAHPSHVEMVNKLTSLGFTYDQEQVNKSMRKDGPFKGVAEYVFKKVKTEKDFTKERQYAKFAHPVSTLSAKVSCNAISIIGNARRKTKKEYFNKNVKKITSSEANIFNSYMNLEPFNYLYVEDVFPKDIYQKLLLATKELKYEEIEKTRGALGYPKRFTASAPEFIKDYLSPWIKTTILEKFGIKDENLAEDYLLIKDYEGYQITPHTDTTAKVISVLFYLPKDESAIDEGTSLFVPKQKGFTCNTGKHYKFEDFTKVKTLPFKPNSMLAFARTDDSFHGVEPSKHVRDVLLYNIKIK